MKDVSDVVTCVFDNPPGLFLPIAVRLGRECKHVYYHVPCEEGFSKVNHAVLGDGLADRNITRVRSIWEVKNRCDLFVFPDIEHSGLQVELRNQGFPVWGSATGDIQEIDRLLFLKTLEKVGLNVPGYKAIRGVAALRDYLSDKEDKFIKITRYRGSMETWQWRNAALDSQRLCLLGHKFGPISDLVQFVVIDRLDTPLEIGADTYCVDGQWPSMILHGDEWKDEGYIGAVTRQDAIPEQIQEVLDAFGPVLKKHRYRNQFSIEMRMLDNEGYFIDPTCRGGLPSTSSQIELWENWPEIVWAGANGELVEPKPEALFTAECVVRSKTDKDGWRTLEIPEKLDRWLQLSGYCMVNDVAVLPPIEERQEVGWLVAQGNTVAEVVKTMLEYAKLLPDGVSASTACLTDLLREVHMGEDQGIEFTSQNVPEPEIAVES